MSALWNVLNTMFAYPQGIVLGNLIASAITGSIVQLRNEYHHNKTQRLIKENNGNQAKSKENN